MLYNWQILLIIAVMVAIIGAIEVGIAFLLKFLIVRFIKWWKQRKS